MTKRMPCAVVVALIVLVLPLSAFAVYEGGWQFNGIGTLNYTGAPDPYGQVDGRIYMPDGVNLVKDGSLLQVIIGRLGAEIVDPLEYFDDPLNGGNSNGAIEGVELENVAAWVQAGADPADISGGTNVLVTMSLCVTGEFETLGGEVSWFAPPGHECCTCHGTVHDKLAWRAWNLTKDELLTWCDLDNHPEMLGVELWYTDGREYFTHENGGGGPDTGWWIGMPDMEAGGDPTVWSDFDHRIGAEIYAHYVLGETTARSQNRLDHYLGICVPEPATVLLAGSALVLLSWQGREGNGPQVRHTGRRLLPCRQAPTTLILRPHEAQAPFARPRTSVR